MHFSAPFVLSLLGLATASPVTNRNPAEAVDSPAGCTDTSQNNFAWEARAFDFHSSYVFTTPSHQNSRGFVSFDLFNPADETTTRCEASSGQLNDFFYGTVEYSCNDTTRAGTTSFDFSRPSGQLRLEQSWTCDDQDPQWPITFTGRGNVNFTLDCNDVTWQNPDWEMGQIYSSRTVTCELVDAEIKPTEMTAVA